MKFLYVRPDVCRLLLSDSTSQWTPLPLAIQFPLLGFVRDLHPLEQAHAEHTKKEGASWTYDTPSLKSFYVFLKLTPPEASPPGEPPRTNFQLYGAFPPFVHHQYRLMSPCEEPVPYA